MASLEKCKICNGDKASSARVCPHCGYREPGKLPVWAWAILILVFGLIIYFMLPINHVVDIQFVKERPAAAVETIVTPAAQEQIQTASTAGYVTADEMLANPSKNYEGQTFAVTGMILDVVYHDYIPYFRLMSVSGVETVQTVQVFFPIEYTSIYNLSYGDVVTCWVTCNELAEYAYQCDLLWFE